MSLLKPSILRFKFDDFARLPSTPGKNVYSERLTDLHGNAWKTFLKPGGSEDAIGQDPFVEVYLQNAGESSVVARCSFILRDARGGVFRERSMRGHLFEPLSNWGAGFVERSAILDGANGVLVDGALLLDVHLQFRPEPRSLPRPPGSLSDRMLLLLENEDRADVSFKVGDAVVTAHAAILQMCAPGLFDLYLESNGASPVTVDGMAPEIFCIILRYAYAEKAPDENMIRERGKEIIDAANRFRLDNLKLLVETALVESLVIDMDSLADWLAFADAAACPLLREQATAYFVSRSADAFRSDAPERLKESPRLLAELIALTTGGMYRLGFS